MASAADLEDLLTIPELAHYLHVHRTTIYRMVHPGHPDRLPGFKVGGSWRFFASEIRYWEAAIEARLKLERGFAPHPKTS